MFPNITLFNKEITFYMLCTLAGTLTVLFYVMKMAKVKKLSDVHALYILLWSFLGVYIGGHILYAFTQYKVILALPKLLPLVSSFEDLLILLSAIFGGAVFYGGLFGALLVIHIYIKKKKLNYAAYFDLASTAFPLFHFFGRLGCFSSGCCYGIESDFGFTMHYSPIVGANGVCRFPVQLLEAFINALIFILLFVLLKKGKAKGRLLPIYLLIYAPARFILEFFRGDELRGFIGPLSTSQAISIAVIIVTVIVLTVNKKRKKIEENE